MIIGRRDPTLFGVVHDTTTTKFAGRTCAAHCKSLPVVVDKVDVVVLKFPNVLPPELQVSDDLVVLGKPKRTTSSIQVTIIDIALNKPVSLRL